MSIFSALFRLTCGRRARFIYLALALFLIAFSGGVRFRSYLLTREIQRVLSGLAQLRVDASTEKDLRRLVPDLVRLPDQRTVPRIYAVSISNEGDQWERWVPRFVYSLWPGYVSSSLQDKWACLPLPEKIAYLIGWRHVAFHASAKVTDGVVSSIGYGLEPDVFVGWPRSYLVVARSVRGFWMRRPDVPVSSFADESPDFRFGFTAGEFTFIAGPESSIGVAYTPAAPPRLVARAFQVDLGCYWGLRGCDSVRQVVPFLWNDEQAIVVRTTARLTGAAPDPCPDSILAGRVRTLPDLNVVLLEVVSSQPEVINHEGDRVEEMAAHYRLKEVIRGYDDGSWRDMRRREAIPWPFSPTGQIANRGPYPGPGTVVLYFSGAHFDSCRVVPATASAIAAVRSAVAPPRLQEDDIGWMWGRM